MRSTHKYTWRMLAAALRFQGKTRFVNRSVQKILSLMGGRFRDYDISLVWVANYSYFFLGSRLGHTDEILNKLHFWKIKLGFE